MKKIKILNANILAIKQTELLRTLSKGVIVTPNIDHLVKLQKDADLYEVYNCAEYVVCDSMVLYFLSKVFRIGIPEPIPGSSFFPAYYNYHKDNPNCKIFLLGAAKGVAEQAMYNINTKVGRKIVIGAYSPSFGFEFKEDECKKIMEIINNSGATTVVVGVGAPKQEKWIHNYRNYMPNVDIWMALGATIDFEAGYKKRAPVFFRKAGIEWVYRMKQEPIRITKRVFEDLIFFKYFFAQLIGIYKDPF